MHMLPDRLYPLGQTSWLTHVPGDVQAGGVPVQLKAPSGHE